MQTQRKRERKEWKRRNINNKVQSPDLVQTIGPTLRTSPQVPTDLQLGTHALDS